MRYYDNVKRKIRCINIDGMEKTGKTSIVREMRKFLKNQEKDLHEIDGVNQEKLDMQTAILNDNSGSFVLKQNGLMRMYYEKLAQRCSIQNIMLENAEIIRREQLTSHEYGSVHFFLIPKDSFVVDSVFHRTNEEVPSYYNDLRDFFERISSTSLTQGLNIELIFFDEFDKIYDIRDKIIDVIEKKYDI